MTKVERGIKHQGGQGGGETHSYMVRRHEIKEVSVVGVQGHDVVDRLAGWQLQCRLIGQGQVGQEGQLRRRKSRGHMLDCSIQTAAECTCTQIIARYTCMLAANVGMKCKRVHYSSKDMELVSSSPS